MASEKLQRILAMSKNMDKKGEKKGATTPQRPMRTPVSLHEQINNANKAVENIDKMYNAPYVPTKEEREAWNTERGREELTEMADKGVFLEKLKQSKLPAAIIESMKQNPCNYDPSVVNNIMGPENELFKKLNEAYGKSKEEPVRGVKAIQQINEQLKTRDKQITEETTTISGKQVVTEDVISSTSNIDLQAIEQIVERVLDRKLNALNESISRKIPSTVRSMSITESGNFRFLDNEDNVYECQMKYLGKRKKK